MAADSETDGTKNWVTNFHFEDENYVKICKVRLNF